MPFKNCPMNILIRLIEFYCNCGETAVINFNKAGCLITQFAGIQAASRNCLWREDETAF